VGQGFTTPGVGMGSSGSVCGGVAVMVAVTAPVSWPGVRLPDAGIRQHGQGPGLSDAPSAYPPDGVEPVVRVPLEIGSSFGSSKGAYKIAMGC
jgi:hypothetical protein